MHLQYILRGLQGLPQAKTGQITLQTHEMRCEHFSNTLPPTTNIAQRYNLQTFLSINKLAVIVSDIIQYTKICYLCLVLKKKFLDKTIKRTLRRNMKKVGDCENFVCLTVNFENETNYDDIIYFNLYTFFSLRDCFYSKIWVEETGLTWPMFSAMPIIQSPLALA